MIFSLFEKRVRQASDEFVSIITDRILSAEHYGAVMTLSTTNRLCSRHNRSRSAIESEEFRSHAAEPACWPLNPNRDKANTAVRNACRHMLRCFSKEAILEKDLKFMR